MIILYNFDKKILGISQKIKNNLENELKIQKYKNVSNLV